MGQNSARTAIAVEWSFVSLSLSVILTRIYLRIFYHHKRPNLSDILVIIGWIFALAGVCCDTMTANLNGMDHANFEGTYDELVAILKIAYADDMLNDVGFYFAKFSLLALYYEIISVTIPKLRIALHIITAYVVAACLLTWGFDTFWCIPISSNWTVSYDVCKVFDQPTLSNINWGLNISSDVAIFILPFFMFRHLSLSRRQSVGLGAIFTLGMITMLCSTARFLVLYLSIISDFAPIYILYSMELNVSLIVVSIPQLRPLIRKSKLLIPGTWSSDRQISSQIGDRVFVTT